MATMPLSERMILLDEVLAVGEGRLDPAKLETARAVRARAGERLAAGDQVVVAGLCGGTGTGKSSLFNALAGAALAPVGVRRPVTTTPVAWAVGEPDASTAVLDWLGVAERHQAAAADHVPDGLVLIDLPDHDSVARDHRAVMDAFVERVDVMVWVVDPLKYAHRTLHDGYLRRLADHAEVLVVVLNRVDELADDELDACLADLRRLLAEDGLARARLLTTSARTGAGVDGLRKTLAAQTRSRRAVGERIAADVRAVARDLAHDTGSAVRPPNPRSLVRALARAAGVERIAEAARHEYRSTAMAGTRSLPGVWCAAFLRLVLRPVRAARGLLPGKRPGGRPAASSAPVAVGHALMECVDAAASGLPERWHARLRSAAGADGVARALAANIDAVPLRPPRRTWWMPMAVVLSLTELTAAAGAVWLAVLGVLGWLQLPVPPAPRLAGELAWPSALLLGGLLVRALLGLVRRRAVRAGAARHRRGVSRSLRHAVEATAEERVLGPIRSELEAHTRLRTLLGHLAA